MFIILSTVDHASDLSYLTACIALHAILIILKTMLIFIQKSLTIINIPFSAIAIANLCSLTRSSSCCKIMIIDGFSRSMETFNLYDDHTAVAKQTKNNKSPGYPG